MSADPAAAVRWYLRTARCDNTFAQDNLGLMRMRGAGSALRRPPPSARETLVLEKKTEHDPDMDGIASHTLLVPKGWSFEGGVLWTPQRPSMPVSFVGRLRGPDGREVTFAPNESFAYASDSSVLRFPGQRDPERTLDGSRIRPAPRRPGEAVLRDVLPALRPRARDVRLILAETPREAQKPLGELLKPMSAGSAQMNRMHRGMGLEMTTRPWYAAERVRVAYEEDGKRWEEEFHLWVFGIHYTTAGFGRRMENGAWFVVGVRAMRAPRDLDAALPTLAFLANSVRETPRWQVSIARLHQQLAAIRAKGARQRARIRARAAEDISDLQMQSWRRRQRSVDRVQHAFTNSIRGVEDYKTPTAGRSRSTRTTVACSPTRRGTTS